MATTECETATRARFYYDRDPALSDPSEPSKSWPITSLVDIACLLDSTADECAEERGCHGAASARAQIGFEDDTFEDIDTLDHPAVTGLPVGEPRDVRKALRRRDGETVWNGNNHIPFSTAWLTELLRRMRRPVVLTDADRSDALAPNLEALES